MNKEQGYSPGEIEEGGFSRHTRSARHEGEMEGDILSQEYPSLLKSGVEIARETARHDLVEIVDRAPDKSVLFIGGKSDQTRTGETGEVYGDELKKISESRENLLVITKQEIDEMREEKREEGGKVLNWVKEVLAKNPDKKVVVAFPLLVKEMSYAYDNRWVEKGRKTDYFKELVNKYEGSHARAVHDWIENQGKLVLPDGRVLQGPHPEKVAREYLRGLSRLQKFAKTQAKNRHVIVHGVGHQWDLDAVATYLAKGEVTKEVFDEISGGKVISESEMVSDVVVTPDGETRVRYRGREYAYKPYNDSQDKDEV